MDLETIREVVNREIAGGLTAAEMEELVLRVTGLQAEAERLLSHLPEEGVEPAPAQMVGEMGA